MFQDSHSSLVMLLTPGYITDQFKEERGINVLIPEVL